MVPRAGAPVAETRCTHEGLRRTYFSDSHLTTPVGPSEPDVPDHLYPPVSIPKPIPLGGVYEGYIRIPLQGRYRFVIVAQGNLRFTVADRPLFERWSDFEWRITSERELRFEHDGWYPIRIENFSSLQAFPIYLTMESAGEEQKVVTMTDFCH